MVNPGGESTMLGQWRIVLRQAEEAARLGRYEEAYALATRPAWQTIIMRSSSAAGWRST